MTYYEPEVNHVTFSTLSGNLSVTRTGELYEMDFPAYQLEKIDVTPTMAQVIGATPIEAYMGRDLLCVFDNEEIIRNAKPDLELSKTLDGLLLHITAPGKNYDCVSRTFAQKLNVPEDPVCGSGHCHIVPYWLNKTGKEELVAYQASSRGGTLYCALKDGRVIMRGNVVTYAVSELFV